MFCAVSWGLPKSRQISSALARNDIESFRSTSSTHLMIFTVSSNHNNKLLLLMMLLSLLLCFHFFSLFFFFFLLYHLLHDYYYSIIFSSRQNNIITIANNMITYHDINYFEIIANYYCMFIRLFIIVVMLKNYLLICRLIRSIII